MTLSVRAALQLEVFGRTPFRVYAGHSGLDRAIRWVHPVEISDIAQFLSGGEMLLTAGMGVGRTPVQQRRYIAEVVAAGAAVLIIELSGRVFASMPDALVVESDRLGFPLIGIDGEVPFVEVSAQVHEFLVDMRVSELTTFERLNETFMQLLLASRDHVSFTEALAHEVGYPVVLEDTSHEVVAYAGATTVSDAILTNWGLHARALHSYDDAPANKFEQTAPHSTTANGGCSRRPVVLRGERWGWIHILHGADPLDNAHTYALGRAADSVAITLLGDRESGARASQRQNSLINRLLLRDITGEQFVARALRMGCDLRERPLMILFVCKDTSSDAITEQKLDATLRSAHAPAVVADTGDHVMAVIGLPRRSSEQQLIEHLSRQRIRAGVSRSGSAALLADAVEQARTAASVAAAQEPPAVVRFDELGVLRLLVSLSRGPELSHYVDDELGALLTHDATATSPLLPTLRAYLDCDGNKSRAADALFIQRRTLYYRLERIDSLLSRSLEEPNVRQGLDLALRALDLLRSQSTS